MKPISWTKQGTRFALVPAWAVVLLLGSCATAERSPAAGGAGAVEQAPGDARNEAYLPADAAPIATTLDASAPTAEPWDFNGAPGTRFRTGNYVLHTTGTHEWMHDYAMRFCEQALEHYCQALCDLAPPDRQLEVYLFARRDEWQEHTRELMGRSADLYLNLGRGGYSTRGRAVLYDIGFFDTFTILSHEGWHVFTQVSFENPLPTWLEEGIATYMEGRRHVPGQPVRFMPWANRQRFETLRRAWERGRLLRLPELIDRSPQQFLKEDTGTLLTYYAQVWAFVHFLMHAEDGKYRAALQRVISDARVGRLTSTILASSNIPNHNNRRRLATSSYGPGVLLAYFNRNYASEMQQEFDTFVERIFTDSDYLTSLVRADAARLNPDEAAETEENSAFR